MGTRRSAIAYPCDDGGTAGPGIADRCAAACAGLPGLLAQQWACNRLTGIVGGCSVGPTNRRAQGEVLALARLAVLCPPGSAPRVRAYALARGPARTGCAPLPAHRMSGWDHYEI